MSDDQPGDLPFRAEYAKSARSSCKQCKLTIDKAVLRLAIMVQSPMFDGKVPHWYHLSCFWQRARPKATGDIAGVENLRWEDQEKIAKKLEAALTGVVGSSSNGGGGGKGAKSSKKKKTPDVRGDSVSHNGTVQKDFRCELSKAGGAKCQVCEEKIKKGLPRIAKKDYDSDSAKRYGPMDRWHHVACFVKIRQEAEYFDGGEDLSGFHTLGPAEMEEIRGALKKIAPPPKRKAEADAAADQPDGKKAKKDDAASAAKEKDAMKKQMKKIYYYRDLLQKNLAKKDLENLLESNGQAVPPGVDRMLDRLSDCMTFGALQPCPAKCDNSQLVFRTGVGYQCVGDVSGFTKCQYTTCDPARAEFVVPLQYREAHDFLAMYKSKLSKRVILDNPPTAASKPPAAPKPTAAANGGAAPRKPLQAMCFVLESKSLSSSSKSALKEKIRSLGGVVAKRVDASTAAVIAAPDDVEAMGEAVAAAKAADVHVVSAAVFDRVKTEGILSQITEKSICEWGSDPKTRLKSALAAAAEEKAGSRGGGGGGPGAKKKAAEMPKSVKLKLKGGAYVDPESGLAEKAHVVKRKDTLYTAVLGAVSIQQGLNSYYKLQLLQHDARVSRYYVFRSWGRVGTTIGGTKLDDFDDLTDAMRQFEFLYEEKTGNRWKNRGTFEKVPGKFHPIDLDMGADNEKVQKLNVAASKSSLHRAIQELMTLIFDIESMKKTMVEFEIDLTKMPLGKLSRKQIDSAYKILAEVMTMVKTESGSATAFLDCSNRFFTLIPHDFGMNVPPILDNPDYIKTKIDMLDSLLEIEVAYNLLTTSEEDEGKDAIDVHYEKLRTDISVLDRASDEFAVLDKYVRNTHADTHNLYELEIVEIFKVSRKGEKQRFKPFQKLHNRQLLWHGSRTTNFAGILSQGLRIAPPEAPVTGYMFGKGLYFADMVSKSANYCCTSRSNNTGLLLLCDVALGDCHERTAADYIEKLPHGKHSTKGVGKTAPAPADAAQLDGANVPFGKGSKNDDVVSDLLYNEYIVYDVAQAKAKYLFRLKFNYKI